MTPATQTCPHCGAPLAVTRFSAVVVCSYCQATVRVDPASVPASKYQRAYVEWNNPAGGEEALPVSIADTYWVKQVFLARGEISDVYLAARARWPTELVLLKILRDAGDLPLLQHEWRFLSRLHATAAAESMDLHLRVPIPVINGERNLACAYRWAAGFSHTFENVREVYPRGVPPVSSIWVWRRILEVLAVMRRDGQVHGAILPNHLLIQNGEHGVRLVGFTCAGSTNAPLRVVCTDFEGFYPETVLDSQKLTPAMDVVMSARCVSYLLGGTDGDLPDHVPPRLSDLLRRVGSDDERTEIEPWQLRKDVGDLGQALFGPPAFHPIEIMT
jgi:hypothetical protein